MANTAAIMARKIAVSCMVQVEETLSVETISWTRYDEVAMIVKVLMMVMRELYAERPDFILQIGLLVIVILSLGMLRSNLLCGSICCASVAATLSPTVDGITDLSDMIKGTLQTPYYKKVY